mgnify:CR=1 FL=1
MPAEPPREPPSIPRLRAEFHASEDALREWLPCRDHLTRAREPRATGISAAPVMMDRGRLTGNHINLNAPGCFRSVRHRVAGTHHVPGHAWPFEETPGSARMAAPTFAAHNAAVFTTVAGRSKAELATLHGAAGITGGHSTCAAGTAR